MNVLGICNGDKGILPSRILVGSANEVGGADGMPREIESWEPENKMFTSAGSGETLVLNDGVIVTNEAMDFRPIWKTPEVRRRPETPLRLLLELLTLLLDSRRKETPESRSGTLIMERASVILPRKDWTGVGAIVSGR